MKKTSVLPAMFLLGFLLLCSFLFELQTVEAQPPRLSLPGSPNNEEPYSYGINIGSPTNTTYTSNSVLLNITLRRPVSPNDYDFTILYSLNGEANVTVPSNVAFFDKYIPGITFSFIASYTLAKDITYLSNLTEGSQTLTVYGIYNYKGTNTFPNLPAWPAVMHDTQTIFFTINDGVPPVIKMLQIKNTTSQNNIRLIVSVAEPVSWLGYSLDESSNVTFSGNVTLNGLAYGSHSVVVYANDTLGNMGKTETMNFTVEKPVAAKPTETLIVVVLAIILVTVASVFLLYGRHRKPKSSEQNLIEKARIS